MGIITLPDFYCPFPPEMHPRVEEVHQHTFVWATQHRLLQQESAIRRFNASRLPGWPPGYTRVPALRSLR